MSSRFPGRLSRRSVERALDGVASAGAPELDELLIAATARPTSFELNGEAAAVATFRAARKGAAPVVAAPTISIRARLGRARWPLAGAAAAVFVSSGVALAATGHLPGALGGHHNPSHHASSRPEASPTGKRTATPDPSYGGLCRAYQAHTARGDKLLTDPAFSALVRKAGGASKVAAYCTDLIGAPGSHAAKAPTTGPTDGATTGTTQPAEPTDTETPTDEPTSESTKKAHPTHPAHPTKKAKPTQGANSDD